MTITDIKIRKIIPDGRLRAVISITVDGGAPAVVVAKRVAALFQ